MAAALALSAACLVGAAQPARAAALPDSVVARLPHRDLTVAKIRESWQRIDPQYRPAGEGLARSRAFLDQLIEKEAMARAALAEPFTMTARETAQYLAHAKNLERQELYRVLVVDSARVNDADRDSARSRLDAASKAAPEPPGALDSAARPWAERRRSAEVEAHIRASLAPAWDDSVAAVLARGYAEVDPSTPNLERPMNATVPDRRPRLAPADTARVLVASSVGPLTVAEFVRRFLTLNPFESPLPTTAGAVQARGEQFLGQMWFDAESARRNLAGSPGVAGPLAERRESIALDHWYRRHITAALDTTTAALEKHYNADPEPYAVPAHALLTHALAPTPQVADSLVAALAAGATWDSICARLIPTERERELCGRTLTVPNDSPDTLIVNRLRTMTPGQAFVRHEADGTLLRIVRLVEHVARRIRPFPEARPYVARDLVLKQSEAILNERMASLVKAMPVTVNERALARLTLEP